MDNEEAVVFQVPMNVTPGTRHLQELLLSKGRELDKSPGQRGKPKRSYGHRQTPETRARIAESLRERARVYGSKKG